MNNIAIFKCNGIREWLITRITGVLIFFYTIYLLFFFFRNDILTYEIWYTFLSRNTIKCFNILVLLSICIHSWIGINHVLTDYIKLFILKTILQSIVITILIGYLLYGIIVVWSI